MKTDAEIIDDIKKYLEGTSLPGEITGVITDLDRPKNSKKEDVCISLLSNEIGQLQMAVVNVNIYVPDILKNNQYVENKPRTRKLQRVCADVLERCHGGFYYFNSDSMSCFKVEGINEHQIKFKLYYKTVNE